ncbi:hypothetical protein M3J09_012063 [Ascochyta lentis]
MHTSFKGRGRRAPPATTTRRARSPAHAHRLHPLDLGLHRLLDDRLVLKAERTCSRTHAHRPRRTAHQPANPGTRTR